MLKKRLKKIKQKTAFTKMNKIYCKCENPDGFVNDAGRLICIYYNEIIMKTCSKNDKTWEISRRKIIKINRNV